MNRAISPPKVLKFYHKSYQKGKKKDFFYNLNILHKHLKAQIIEYEVIENQLDNGKTFRDKIYHTLAMSNQSLVEKMVKKNCTVTSQEALAAIKMQRSLIIHAPILN